MQYIFKIILVQGFCPLKIKITQFPGGFRLNFLQFSTSIIESMVKGLVTCIFEGTVVLNLAFIRVSVVQLQCIVCEFPLVC